MLRGLIDAVAGLDGQVLVLVIAGLAFAETAFLLDLVVPGEVGMVIAGAAGAQADVPLVALVVGAAVGATVGDTVSYLLGRRFGTGLVRRWAWTRRRVAPGLDRTHAYFERHGGRAVFVGRWVGAMRAVVPLVAGSAGMQFRRFVLWNVAASLSWGAAVVSAGYLLGAEVAGLVDRIGQVVSGLALVALALWWLARRRRPHAPAGEPAAKGTFDPGRTDTFPSMIAPGDR